MKAMQHSMNGYANDLTNKTTKENKMASITEKLLKTRVSKPTLGKWSSGFTACKKYADDNKVPLIAVWSNGDSCGHCTTFETAVMNSAFTKWMASSKCVFWFGCSSDKTKDDKFEGTGFTWTRNSKLTTYPFVRVWWKAGKVDKYDSGDYWDGKSSKGYNTFISKLKTLLKNYKPETPAPAPEPVPEPEPTPAPAPEPGTNENDCTDGNCSFDDNQKKVDELVSKTKDVESKLAALEAELDALKADAKALLCDLEGGDACKA